MLFRNKEVSFDEVVAGHNGYIWMYFNVSEYIRVYWSEYITQAPKGKAFRRWFHCLKNMLDQIVNNPLNNPRQFLISY